MMNLPNVILELIKAQKNFDSHSYAGCFTETAIVLDEENTYNGKNEIENWIDKANKKYRTTMKPLDYNQKESVLSAEISGNFPGSPLMLQYHFELTGDLIQSLKITG